MGVHNLVDKDGLDYVRFRQRKHNHTFAVEFSINKYTPTQIRNYINYLKDIVNMDISLPRKKFLFGNLVQKIRDKQYNSKYCVTGFTDEGDRHTYHCSDLEKAKNTNIIKGNIWSTIDGNKKFIEKIPAS